MLVLSRKPGEEICIDERISVTVVSVQGGRVRLGIAAPADIRVLRKELIAKLLPDIAANEPTVRKANPARTVIGTDRLPPKKSYKPR